MTGTDTRGNVTGSFEELKRIERGAVGRVLGRVGGDRRRRGERHLVLADDDPARGKMLRIVGNLAHLGFLSPLALQVIDSAAGHPPATALALRPLPPLLAQLRAEYTAGETPA